MNQIHRHISARMATSPAAAPRAPSASADATRTKPSASSSSTSSFLIPALLVALLALGVAVSVISDPVQLKIQSTRLLELLERRLSSPATTTTPSFGSSSSSSSVDCSTALAHLTDVAPVKGFHVLCIKPSPLDTLLITAYKDGMQPNRSAESAIDIMAFRHTLESLLEIPPPVDAHATKYKQPYAFFTPEGERLQPKLSVLAAQGVVFLFEGGQFIWPGIRIGHRRIVKNVYGKGDVAMVTLSLIPLVFSVEEFLKDGEIDVILELSLPHLQPSGVTLSDDHKGRPATDWRTSTTYFLPSSAHAIVQEIDKRTADLVKVPTSHQEFVQVLRYEESQKYDHHQDYFSVARHRESPKLLEKIEYGHKNRMITVFWYMSDVAKGGHTIFPRAGGLPSPASMKDCSVGLKVAPQKRKVIVFYSMLPNGDGDPMSLHGGCPVEDGVKYSGNKWVWNKPRHDIP